MPNIGSHAAAQRLGPLRFCKDAGLFHGDPKAPPLHNTLAALILLSAAISFREQGDSIEREALSMEIPLGEVVLKMGEEGAVSVQLQNIPPIQKVGLI